MHVRIKLYNLIEIYQLSSIQIHFNWLLQKMLTTLMMPLSMNQWYRVISINTKWYAFNYKQIILQSFWLTINLSGDTNKKKLSCYTWLNVWFVKLHPFKELKWNDRKWHILITILNLHRFVSVFFPFSKRHSHISFHSSLFLIHTICK